MKSKSKTLKQIQKDSEKLGPSVKLGPSRVMTKSESDAIDKKADLQMISLRLPLHAIEKLKLLADKEGIKYQPYIRRHLLKLAATGDEKQLTESRVQELIDQRFEKLNRERAKKVAS